MPLLLAPEQLNASKLSQHLRCLPGSWKDMFLCPTHLTTSLDWTFSKSLSTCFLNCPAPVAHQSFECLETCKEDGGSFSEYQ